MFENSTDSHASDSGAAGREGRTTLGAQAKPLHSQMALSRKPFLLGHSVYSQTQLIDFIKVYFLHCFVQRHVSALVIIFSTHTTFNDYNTL